MRRKLAHRGSAAQARLLMYQQLIRPIFFLFDAEKVHSFTFGVLRMALSVPFIAKWCKRRFCYEDPTLARTVWGIRFRNPVGLAAGFDKDALLADKWQYLGFGCVEVGTVTPRPQAGNDKPRLFRLPQDRAIINRMGFNNAGVDALAARLHTADRSHIVIGANIGKNKDTPNEMAINDYMTCLTKLYDLVDYFVVNVSSPNTPGLRELQEKRPLMNLLGTLQTENRALAQQRNQYPKPLLLKIAPDLTESQLLDIVEVAKATSLAGIIATNTTISRENLQTNTDSVSLIGTGGLSGAPLTQRSQEVLSFLKSHLPADIEVVGVGGIMSGDDAKARLKSGATLLQTYTGFIYGGAGFAKQICLAIRQ